MVAVVVNADAKGEFFAYLAADGDTLVRRADLTAMGFRELEGAGRVVDGEDCLSLRSVRHLAFRINAKTASLKIAAAPRLLRNQVIDLGLRDERAAVPPEGTSYFLNYGARYREDDAGARRWSLATEAAARARGVLLVSDGILRGTEEEREFARLMSRAIYDRRGVAQRITLGDFAAATDELGRPVIMAGLAFEKNYDLDPYAVRNPVYGFSGVSALPAEVEISVDGVPLRREKIGPGEFEVRNLWTYGGHRRVDVTIRDIFGNEMTQGGDFYFSDRLLRPGFQEYGYRLGFLREDFGDADSGYGAPALSAYHRAGLGGGITAGLVTEGGDGVINGGGDVAFPLGSIGLLRAAGRLSRREAEAGRAALLSYGYQGPLLSASLAVQQQSRDYAVLAGSASPRQAGRRVLATTSLRLSPLATVSLGYNALDPFEGPQRRVVSLSYARNVTAALSLYATARRIRSEGSANEVLLGLTWRPGRQVLAVRHERRDDRSATTLEAAEPPPVGEGSGYRATARRSDERTAAALNLRHHGRVGEYEADFEGYVPDAGDGHGSVEVAAAGSVAGVGDTLAFGRPIRDAFAIAEVERLPGIRVYRNGEEVGRTNAAGRALIPRVDSFHHNAITIADSDVPMSYTIRETTRALSPGYREGALVRFELRRFQALSGRLQADSGKGPAPLEYREGRLAVGERTVAIVTGTRGEFYLEDVPAGSYEAVVPLEGKEARCAIVVPISEEPVVELGTIFCPLR